MELASRQTENRYTAPKGNKKAVASYRTQYNRYVFSWQMVWSAAACCCFSVRFSPERSFQICGDVNSHMECFRKTPKTKSLKKRPGFPLSRE